MTRKHKRRHTRKEFNPLTDSLFDQNINLPKPRKLTKKQQKSQDEAMFFFIAGLGIFLLVWQTWNWASTHLIQAIAYGILTIVAISLLIYFIPSARRKFAETFGLYYFQRSKLLNRIIHEVESMDIKRLRSEEDFEHQLYQRLSAKDFSVKTQHRKGRSIIDLLVNGTIGVELKIAKNGKYLQSLIGQAYDYCKYYSEVLVVIVDIGQVQDISYYTRQLKEISEKITVKIVKSEYRPQKPRYVAVDQRYKH